MKRTNANETRRITRLVRELMGGKPVSQISLEDVRPIIGALAQEREIAAARSRGSRLQRIDRVVSELEKYESSRRPRTPRKKGSTADCDFAPPTVLNSVLDDLISGIPNDIVETRMIPSLTEHAKTIINDLLSTGEYVKAQHYENVHQSLVSLLIARQVQEQKLTKYQTIQANIVLFTTQLEQEQEKLKTILGNIQSKIDQSVKEEDDRWAIELSAFDQITLGKLPPGARKLSSRLLNLRQQERSLLSSRRYQDAAGIKSEADQLEEEEMQRLRQEFVRKREAQKTILESIHEQKRKCIFDKGERSKSEIIRSGEKELERLRQAIENMQMRLQQLDMNDVHIPAPPATEEPTFVTQKPGSPPTSGRKPKKDNT
jgi:hypothetical protein